MSTLIGYARVQAAIHHVCEEFGVTKLELISRSRPERIAWPRQVAIGLSYEFSDLAQRELASLFQRCQGDISISVQAFHARVKTNRKARVKARTIQHKITNETFG